MAKRMIFIFNPRAGKGRIKLHLMDIIDVFNKSGYEVLVYATQNAGDAREKAGEYCEQVDLIVCSGGDGTLDEVVTGIMEKDSQVPIGYIPAGSTNDFANSLFMPKSMLRVAEGIMQENLYCCDIGRFNDRTFAYVAAFGVFTEVSYGTDQNLKNILGHGAYILEGIKSLTDIKAYHLKVESEELNTQGEFLFGMVSNSRSVGGFKNLTGKNIDMNDGLFEVTLIRMPRNPIELNEIITALVMATDNTDMVYTFKTAKIVIEAEDEIPWTLDGEFGGNIQRAEIENRHQALNLYLANSRDSKRLETKDE